MKKKTKKDNLQNNVCSLFHLFTRTHSAHRACILISVNLKMPIDEIESLLYKEILNADPVKKVD